MAQNGSKSGCSTRLDGVVFAQVPEQRVHGDFVAHYGGVKQIPGKVQIRESRIRKIGSV